MKVFWRVGVAGVVLASAVVVPGSAEGATSAVCTMSLGAATVKGEQTRELVTASSPPRLSGRVVGPKVWEPSWGIRASGSMTTVVDNPAGDQVRQGWQVGGTTGFQTWYRIDAKGTLLDLGVTDIELKGTFTAVETSRYHVGATKRTTQYALRSDGTLMRWAMDEGNYQWSLTGSAGGFAAVKTMALISQTATYDTFLANTRGGALYTIRVPLSSPTQPMKPVVTVVRRTTWQNFEYLVAERCGTQSTLLLAVDSNTATGYLYAVGHGKGAATLIQGLGSVGGTLHDSVYFRWTGLPGTTPPLYGE
jgi:hypothetical protein